MASQSRKEEPVDPADVFRLVIGQALKDLCDSSERLRLESLHWIIEPRGDFERYCRAAGVEPVKIRKPAIELAKTPYAGRKQALQVVRQLVDAELLACKAAPGQDQRVIGGRPGASPECIQGETPDTT